MIRELLHRLRPRAAAGHERDPADDFWYGSVWSAAAAGVAVTPETALRLPVVLDCLHVLAQPIASLPLKLYRRRADGGKAPVEGHELGLVLGRQANAEQTAYEFRGQMQWDLALHGNAYARIGPGRRYAVGSLTRLDPTLVSPRRRSDGRPVYEVRDPRAGVMRTLGPDEVWHLRGLPLDSDGLVAAAPIETGREAIAMALALQDYAARFFANDATPNGVVEMAGPFKDAESRDNWIRAWQRAHAGRNRHKIGVLEPGMTYKEVSIANDKAQFIETAKEADLRVARIWRIPPHKVGILDRATFSNIEQQALEFVSDTLLPWLRLWEQAISRDLIVRDPTLFAEFNVAGLLRGDLKSRYEAYAVGRNWGWLSVNDVRRLENMNPLDDGDGYLRPLNMVPADAPADGDPSASAGRPFVAPPGPRPTPPGAGNGRAEIVEPTGENDDERAPRASLN